MASNHLISGLDIGTNNIKVLVAQETPQGLKPIFQIQEKSRGVRRGVVVEVDLVSQILGEIFSKIKKEIGQKIEGVYVNVGGSHLFSFPSRGVISVSRADQRISEEDVSRVLQAAQIFSLPSNKEVFFTLPKEFIVDGEGGIKDPVGLKGVRLEAEILAVGGFSPYLNNLSQAVLNADLEILGMIPSAVASAQGVLTPQQKELGVALLDIGAGTTDLAVYEEGDLIHLAVLPIGANNITNDIAIGLRTDVEIAERIKIEYGFCVFQGSNKREKIDVGEEEPLVFSKKQLVKIIEARASQIFKEINKELKKIGKEKSLPSGVVLTGGCAKLPKIVELAKREFKLPVKIGKPPKKRELSEPSLAAVWGLVLSGEDLEKEKGPSFGKGFINKLKKFFKIFIP